MDAPSGLRQRYGFRVLLFEIDGRARQRAARANGAGKPVNLTLGLLPDFGPGGLNMGLTIGNIVKLIGPDSAIFGAFGKFCASRPEYLM